MLQAKHDFWADICQGTFYVGTLSQVCPPGKPLTCLLKAFRYPRPRSTTTYSKVLFDSQPLHQFLSYSVWVAITKHHRLSVVYKQQKFLSPSSGGSRSKIRLSGWSNSGESPPWVCREEVQYDLWDGHKHSVCNIQATLFFLGPPSIIFETWFSLL